MVQHRTLLSSIEHFNVNQGKAIVEWRSVMYGNVYMIQYQYCLHRKQNDDNHMLKTTTVLPFYRLILVYFSLLLRFSVISLFEVLRNTSFFCVFFLFSVVWFFIIHRFLSIVYASILIIWFSFLSNLLFSDRTHFVSSATLVLFFIIYERLFLTFAIYFLQSIIKTASTFGISQSKSGIKFTCFVKYDVTLTMVVLRQIC
jgi:hypothetical protein